MERVATVGVGSTNFRYAAATPSGEFCTDVTVEPTRPRDLDQQVLDAVDDLRARAGAVDAVAVSTAGLVDAEAGVVREFDTPAGDVVERVDLGGAAAERSLPLYLENDCSAAALGEWYFGARTDEQSVVHLTMGTGIGGGVVEQGRLIRGGSGQAGEFGLLPVAPHDVESCGITGAWEAVCSGRGIPRYVRRRLAETDRDSALRGVADLAAPDVFAAADDDAFAADCLAEIARYNAAGVGAVANAVNPDLVTLGGGVALNNAAWAVSGIESHLDEFCFVDPPTVETTDLGDDVGLYGALATYLARRDADIATGSGAERAADATD